ncbi:hypothetical protein QNI16_00110 [Cytophagaceae bacterium YF14B1]|uniref:Peptidase M4 n=1 Tax=Xanthocytophaga flava TaxID=3048013 RepID=A0AAE3U455_9BACT|nr:hypothetical protein [Xanthocytophaga flavus]MDJ1478861.1 hypothetical protein [Xanthocytophaga flavus]
MKKPTFRKLRGYAFDPSLSLQLDTVLINDVIYKIDWEEVEEGPVGEYIEVVDYDPSVNTLYKPVNLNHPHILATDGIDPSEGNPQFHQQMVYAVAMTTIKNFESALGRKAIWSSREMTGTKSSFDKKYVQRLRIYPHALREANAYYSPHKKALLFGYFSSYSKDTTLSMPESVIFTCLSHDIIAHETAHALLDGMHQSFTYPTNPDVLAFHEAFADIVALFQHFTFPEVLKHQIAKTRGNLESQNLLGQLAQQFGKAIGLYSSLRDAIGETDKDTNTWKPKKPDPIAYNNLLEPHKRGGILVAIIFDAFISIYKRRVEDLLRIASGGSGLLSDGALHPDLVNRLAEEAAKSAAHVLKMCIRALDYCPTLDITFGDYLRAIITADVDLIDDDSRAYRLSFIESFRKWGIYPKGIKTLSVESLVYKPVNHETLQNEFSVLSKFLREFRENIIYLNNRRKIFEATDAFMGGKTVRLNRKKVVGLHKRLSTKFSGSTDFEKLTGLIFSEGWEKLGVRTSTAYKSENISSASFQVSSLKLANRVGYNGKIINHIILTLIQRCGVIYNKDEDDPIEPYVPNKVRDSGLDDNKKIIENGFDFRGSCTLIFDLDTLELKYSICKPLLDLDELKESGNRKLNKRRVKEQYEWLFERQEHDIYSAYFNGHSSNLNNEPFAFLHHTH